MFEIGNSLREARSRQGLDLAQLEADTRIRRKYLRALEDEQFDLLPGEAYVRGFLRQYAERLELDGDVYVDEYNARFASDDGLASGRVQRPKGARRLNLESRAAVMAVLGIIAVTVLVIAAWQFASSDDGSASPAETVDSAPAPTPAEASPPPPVAPPSAPPPLPPAPPAVPPPAPPPPVSEVEGPSPAVDEHATLMLRAVGGRSHVLVRNGTRRGKVLFDAVLPPGEHKRFRGKRLYVLIKKPGVLVAEVNGEVYSSLPTAPAPLIVTAEGARTGRGV